MIRNATNQVAVAYGRSHASINFQCGTREYWLFSQHAVSLAWVNEEDLPCALAVTRWCCGGNKQGAVVLATQEQVDRWNGV
jgi:hypothetical protein